MGIIRRGSFGPRLFAWMSALGAILIVAAIYDRMPEMIPVTRWSSSPRSPLIALRIPLINLLSVVLIEVIVRALLRSSREVEARKVAMALSATVGLKSLLEGLELYLLPWRSPLIPGVLLVVVVGGVCAASAYGRRLLKGPIRPEIEFSRNEKIAAAISVIAICALQWAFIIR